jgi:NAD(P)-dependent dehydrogenase (short-subunit alcohol dehydrogenase family)
MAGDPIFSDLEDASVLITGGASGIGAALAEGFLRQRARVAFVDVAREAGEGLAARLEAATGTRPLFIAADLRDIGAIRAAVDRACRAHGPVAVLVNNAALDDRHEIESVTEQFWDDNQAVNLRPHFFTAQAVTAGMKAAGRGAIVNFTSTSFMINHGGMPSYTAAKAGIVGLTKGLAGALGPSGIRVNAIAPGWVMTERQRRLWAEPDAVRAHIDRQCLKREMVPADMVGPCLFLASDAASMVTAQTIIVDGGVL